MGIPWHVVALVQSTDERKTYGARSDEEGWKNTTAEGFLLQEGKPRGEAWRSSALRHV